MWLKEFISEHLVEVVVTAILVPFSAWIGRLVERRKYDIELRDLKATMEKKVSEVTKSELENVREANEILMESIVLPLRTEIKTLRNGLNRLNRALEKIPACPYAASCPISYELQREERGSGEEAAKARARTREQAREA